MSVTATHQILDSEASLNVDSGQHFCKGVRFRLAVLPIIPFTTLKECLRNALRCGSQKAVKESGETLRASSTVRASSLAVSFSILR